MILFDTDIRLILEAHIKSEQNLMEINLEN